MTVNTQSITDGPYAGNDIAASFAYNFRIDENTEIAVYETDDLGVTTLLTLTTHYTVSGVGNPAGGSVTRVAGALPTGYSWYIRSAYVPTQLTAFASQGGFFPDVHEYVADKLSYIAQQLKDELRRALRLDLSDSSIESGNMTLPTASQRALKFVGFDSNGDVAVYDGTGQATDSVLVNFTGSGAGAVTTNARDKLRERVSVKDFGAVGDGVTDDTAAVQAAIDFARVNNNETIELPSGRYLITDTISIGAGTKIKGANIDYGGVAGGTSIPLQLSDSKGTVIIFAPTTEKSLFVPSLPKGGSMAWNGISIRGLNIWGNTTPDLFHRTELGIVDDITTSLYAIDFEQVAYSNVEDVSITGFQAGIREGYRCQHNNFNKVNIQRCRAGVLYSAMVDNAEATSSVWRSCVIRTAAVAVQCVDTAAEVYSGDSLQIRFHGCYFEDISNYGFLLSRMAKDWCLVDCYGEQIGRDTSVATRACFWVGAAAGAATGSKLNSVSIIGGQYAGDDSAASTFLKADYTDGINLIGCTGKRFGIGISATANTRGKSIYMANPLFNSVTTLFSGTTSKLHGIYRTIDTSGGSDAVILKMDTVSSDTDLTLTPSVGNNVRLGDGSTTGDVRPGNANVDLGDSAIRFRYIYASNLTTDVDYLLWGKTAYTSFSTDGVWLHKSGWVGSSMTSSPAGYFNRNGTDGGLINFYKAGTGVGSISVTEVATAYNTSSDYRLKDNVTPLSGSGAFIDSLRPVAWTWKVNGDAGAGFIAHELQAVSPSSVTGFKDEVDGEGNPVYQSVEYGSAEVIAMLVAEVQDLRRRLASAGVA